VVRPNETESRCMRMISGAFWQEYEIRHGVILIIGRHAWHTISNMSAVAPRFPAIRARWTQLLLRETRALPEPERGRILAALEPGDLEKIDRAAALGWLPVEINMRLVRGAYRELGAPAYVALYRRAANANLSSPLLRAIAMGARMLGRNALMEALPRGWDIVLRNCGRVRVARDARRRITHVELEGVPSPIRDDAAFRLGIAGVLAACMDFGGYVGRVHTDPVDDETIRYRLSLVEETTIEHGD
jgi:hypothetical protein